MPRAPKNTKPKARKKNDFIEIVKNLVEIPVDAPKSFWPREVKLAKDLCVKFGLEKVQAWTPQEKYVSIAYLVVAEKELGLLLDRNYRMKNVTIPTREVIQLEDEPLEGPKGISYNKNTIKSWLDQKK